jgi:hypothetical protein
LPFVGSLELQAGFARSLGQGLDAAVEGEARTVESHLLDAGGLGLSAMRLPTMAAAEVVPPLPLPPNCSRTAFSAVEALASTRLPSSEMTLA